MPSFPHARREESGVACGRRSRHEPLRAPGRTRSGDLPLTRRTLYRLSYRGECRPPPAVRRRPPRARHMGPDREEGYAIVPVRGVRRFRGTGRRGPAVRTRRDGSAASRAMEESNLRPRFGGPSGCRCPDGAFIVSALRFSTMPCRPCPRRHGMVCVRCRWLCFSLSLERSHLHGLVAETGSKSHATVAAAWFAFRRMPHCPAFGAGLSYASSTRV